MMSAKNEKHSLLATLWFQVAHFALRPWPWIIVALVVMVKYPDLPAAHKGEGFIMVIRDILPPGLIGLLMATFLAAYMSCLSSQTVWGTSYIVNDLFRPFIKPGATEKYYVRVARISTVVLIIFSLIVTSKLERISDAWKFIIECSGGIGLVLILRWFWWRINAWTEISAIIAPFIIYPFLKHYNIAFPDTLLYIVAWATIVWITVTFLTKPTDEETLLKFHRKVHPGGWGWKDIAAKAPDVVTDKGYGILFVNWFMGCLLVLFSLFGIGKIIFGETTTGLVFIGIALAAGAVIYRNMAKMGWGKIAE
jgi:SSS family solute:Na+ symporter